MAGTAAKEGKKGEKRKGSATPVGENYVLRGKDGKLYLASGKTGQVRELKKDQKMIESLIEQRQALGRKLSQLLDKQGYVVAVAHPTNVIEPGPDEE